MKAIFELKSIVSQWSPPFGKKIEQEELLVDEGQGFDALKKRENEFVFRLLELKGEKALIQFHSEYLVKGYGNHPVAVKQLWFELDDSKEFTFQWADKGITKKLTFKGIKTSHEIQKQEEETKVAEEEKQEEREKLLNWEEN